MVTGINAVAWDSSTFGRTLAIAANMKIIRIGEVILFASLKLFAKIQTQRLTADENMENTGRQISKERNAGINNLKSKSLNPRFCMSKVLYI